MRFTIVRGMRPLRGSVKIAASVARRSASDVDGAERASSGKRNDGPGVFVPRDVAAVELQRRFGREVRREAVRVLQLPLADEAVVAGVALEVDAKEDLRRVLRRLHPRGHRGARLAAPVDADDEPGRVARLRGIDQPARSRCRACCVSAGSRYGVMLWRPPPSASEK